MILLHVCCADCLLQFVRALGAEQLDLFYYNPNIHPRSEYLARLKAIKKVLKKQNFVGELIVPNYRPQEYFQKLKQDGWDIANFSLTKKRCALCWQLRLAASFKYAAENNYDRVSTTLLASQYQDRTQIKQIGQKLAKEHAVELVEPKIICSRLKTKGFYKQSYCGCCFSLVEKKLKKHA